MKVEIKNRWTEKIILCGEMETYEYAQDQSFCNCGKNCKPEQIEIIVRKC